LARWFHAMNDDLAQLLRRADADAIKMPRIAAGELLSAAVARRRQIVVRRRAALGFALALLCGSAAWRGSRNPTSGVPAATAFAEGRPRFGTAWSLQRPGRSADGDELRREIARLDRDAAVHLAVVRGLQGDAPAKDEFAGAGSSPDAAELARQEEARSAAISLQYAVLVERELHDAAAAEREYRRVAERFPRTEWADFAVASLARLMASDDDASL
jgi:hypothetical protein